MDKRDGERHTSFTAELTGAVTLRRLAEERVATLEAGRVESLSAEETRLILHELRVHQAELEMQNEELRRAEEALEVSRERYVDLYDLAPVGYLTLGTARVVREANLHAATVLECDRVSLIGQPLSRFVLGEDQDIYYKHAKRLCASGEPQVCEVRLVRAGGAHPWVRMDMALARYGQGGEEDIRVTLVETTARKRMEEELKAVIGQKDLLMREVLHRTKNNMATVISLLHLNERSLQNGYVSQVLQDTENRILSLVQIQQELYQSSDIARIDLKPYLSNLAGKIFDSLRSNTAKASLLLDMEPVLVSPDTAIPCGLILNEMLTNAVKHAFPDGGGGGVTVSLHPATGGSVLLMVRDTGVGLPEGFNPRTVDTLGLKLVANLVRQLRGTLEWESSGGSVFRVRFPNG